MVGQENASSTYLLSNYPLFHTCLSSAILLLPVTLGVALLDLVVALPKKTAHLRFLQGLFLQVLSLRWIQVLPVAVVVAGASPQGLHSHIAKFVCKPAPPLFYTIGHARDPAHSNSELYVYRFSSALALPL